MTDWSFAEYVGVWASEREGLRFGVVPWPNHSSGRYIRNWNCSVL